MLKLGDERPGLVPAVRDWTMRGISIGLAIGATGVLVWYVVFQVIAKFPAVE